MTSPIIEQIDFATPDASVVTKAASILEDGALVVAPTETRYGLLARADKAEAVSRLYSVKGRPAQLPTAIFVPDIESLSNYGRPTPLALKIAERFLPGPLTLVMESDIKLPEPLVVDGKIGIRISPAPFIKALLAEVVFPLTATSANPSGEKELDTVDEIARAFGGKVDMYIDAGLLDEPVSTVLDVSDETPVILREGAITAAELETLGQSKAV